MYMYFTLLDYTICNLHRKIEKNRVGTLPTGESFQWSALCSDISCKSWLYWAILSWQVTSLKLTESNGALLGHSKVTKSERHQACHQQSHQSRESSHALESCPLIQVRPLIFPNPAWDLADGGLSAHVSWETIKIMRIKWAWSLTFNDEVERNCKDLGSTPAWIEIQVLSCSWARFLFILILSVFKF